MRPQLAATHAWMQVLAMARMPWAEAGVQGMPPLRAMRALSGGHAHDLGSLHETLGLTQPWRRRRSSWHWSWPARTRPPRHSLTTARATWPRAARAGCSLCWCVPPQRRRATWPCVGARRLCVCCVNK